MLLRICSSLLPDPDGERTGVLFCLFCCPELNYAKYCLCWRSNRTTVSPCREWFCFQVVVMCACDKGGSHQSLPRAEDKENVPKSQWICRPDSVLSWLCSVHWGFFFGV